MKKLMLITLILIVVISMPTTVSAAYMDLHWTEENPTSPYNPTPKDPEDASAGWNWDNPYSHTGNVPDGTKIGAGNTRIFALENRWLGEEYIKTVTLEFDYVGGAPVLAGADFGYHPLNYVGGRKGPPEETDNGVHYKFVFTIDPQPEWEWLLIWNMAFPAQANATQANATQANADQANVMTISNFSLTSVCVVPEPATLSLLALGGLALRRRRKV